MPDEKKAAKPKKPKVPKPKLQYIDKDFQWVLKEPWKDNPAGTPWKPKMPSWAVRSGGEIDFNRFIKAWNDANSLEDVHKKFWWKKPNQLSRQRTQISDWLENEDINPLKTLRSKRAKRKQWGTQLASLLKSGELTRKYSRRTAEQQAVALHNELEANKK